MTRRPTLFALTLSLAASAATAQPRPVALSAVEHALGASPIHRVAGHGRLTVGVTREGDLAVLAWPSPSCCDQLTHLASNDLDARTQPRVGVREGLGASVGVVLTTTAGERVAWLHDPTTFRVVRAGYRDADGLTPVGVYEHTATGVRVELTDAVMPADDVLQRRVHVTVPTTAGVTAVAVMAYANLGPTRNVVPRLPLGDVLVDARNEYAAVWDEARGAMVHFRPVDADPVRDIVQVLAAPAIGANHFGPLDALMRDSGDITAGVRALTDDLDARFGRGVYIHFGATPRPVDHQAGGEDDTFCDALDHLIDNVVDLGSSGIALPLNPGIARVFRCSATVRGDALARARMWTRRPTSAWQDAQDGALSHSPLAAWRADTALRVPVTLDAMGAGEARLFLSFGETAAASRERLLRAQAMTADAVEALDRDAWRARVTATTFATAPTRLGADDRTRIDAAARRALLHVFEGTDAATGMIVASIARQAPYALDWPRDGAFFDYALDVAGHHAATTRRLRWALPLARSAPVLPAQIYTLTDPAPPIDPRTGTAQYPESAWEMNYYDSGEMGGFFRFEIDNTAWMIWSAAVHAAFVPEADRRAYADSVWDPVRRSADLLAAWRDPRTALQAVANEDDNAVFSASLHGGVSVFSALEACARLARFTQHPDDAARWERRASELRDALLRTFYNESEQRFVNDVSGAAASNPGSSSLGATAWLVWPARLLPYSDPRMARQVRRDLTQVLAILRGDSGTDGGAYLTKTMLSAAAFLAGGGDATVQPLLDEAVARMARDVFDPDTQTVGEVFVTVRDADGGVTARENRVSIPHLWEATLFELTVAAMQDPARFDLDLRALPAAQTPPPGTVPFTPVVDPVDASVPRDAATVDAARTPAMTAGDGCGCRAAGASGRGAVMLALLVGLMLRRRARSTR